MKTVKHSVINGLLCTGFLHKSIKLNMMKSVKEIFRRHTLLTRYLEF